MQEGGYTRSAGIVTPYNFQVDQGKALDETSRIAQLFTGVDIRLNPEDLNLEEQCSVLRHVSIKPCNPFTVAVVFLRRHTFTRTEQPFGFLRPARVINQVRICPEPVLLRLQFFPEAFGC